MTNIRNEERHITADSKANKRVINIMNSFMVNTIENLHNIENLFERQIIKTYTGRSRKQKSCKFLKILNV